MTKPTYLSATKCKACGSGERYVGGRRCAPCHRKATALRKLGLVSGNKEAAILADLERCKAMRVASVWDWRASISLR